MTSNKNKTLQKIAAVNIIIPTTTTTIMTIKTIDHPSQIQMKMEILKTKKSNWSRVDTKPN